MRENTNKMSQKAKRAACFLLPKLYTMNDEKKSPTVIPEVQPVSKYNRYMG